MEPWLTALRCDKSSTTAAFVALLPRGASQQDGEILHIDGYLCRANHQQWVRKNPGVLSEILGANGVSSSSSSISHYSFQLRFSSLGV